MGDPHDQYNYMIYAGGTGKQEYILIADVFSDYVESLLGKEVWDSVREAVSTEHLTPFELRISYDDDS